MSDLAHRIRQAGKTPHCKSTKANQPALGLYEKTGWKPWANSRASGSPGNRLPRTFVKSFAFTDNPVH